MLRVFSEEDTYTMKPGKYNNYLMNMIGRYEYGDEAWVEVTKTIDGYEVRFSHIESKNCCTADEVIDMIVSATSMGYKLNETSVVENLLKEYE
jgi:hypothetical protein